MCRRGQNAAPSARRLASSSSSSPAHTHRHHPLRRRRTVTRRCTRSDTPRTGKQPHGEQQLFAKELPPTTSSARQRRRRAGAGARDADQVGQVGVVRERRARQRCSPSRVGPRSAAERGRSTDRRRRTGSRRQRPTTGCARPSSSMPSMPSTSSLSHRRRALSVGRRGATCRRSTRRSAAARASSTARRLRVGALGRRRRRERASARARARKSHVHAARRRQYYLQIDSHMRFVEHWDELVSCRSLVGRSVRRFAMRFEQRAQLLACHRDASARCARAGRWRASATRRPPFTAARSAVISAYPIGYELPNVLPPRAICARARALARTARSQRLAAVDVPAHRLASTAVHCGAVFCVNTHECARIGSIVNVVVVGARAAPTDRPTHRCRARHGPVASTCAIKCVRTESDRAPIVGRPNRIGQSAQRRRNAKTAPRPHRDRRETSAQSTPRRCRRQTASTRRRRSTRAAALSQTDRESSTASRCRGTPQCSQTASFLSRFNPSRRRRPPSSPPSDRRARRAAARARAQSRRQCLPPVAPRRRRRRRRAGRRVVVGRADAQRT